MDCLGWVPYCGGETEARRRQRQQGGGGNRLVGFPAHTEQPQGSHRHGQPQVGGALGIGHADALPLPPRPFGDFEPLLDPRSQAIPTHLARAGSQIGQQQPRVGVPRLPPRQQRAIEPTARTDKDRPRSHPLRAGLGDQAAQRLIPGTGSGPKGAPTLRRNTECQPSRTRRRNNQRLQAPIG